MEMELCIDFDRIENKLQPCITLPLCDCVIFTGKKGIAGNNHEAYKDTIQGALTNASPSKIYVLRGSFRGHLGKTRPSPSTSEGSEELVIN